MFTASVSIDVPSLEQGFRFYSEAFGFTKVAEPVPGVVVLKAGAMTVCLLEKKAGSKPAPKTADARKYERHWTPVHLDFQVDDLARAIERVTAAGAVVEQRFDNPDHGSAAFCSDPFGHGFCLLQH